MIDNQSAAWKARRFAQLAAAAAVLLAISPAAKAQGLFSFFDGGPSPYDIERRLDAGGYVLTGPLIRRGDVYLADVAVGRGDSERLAIDAETGRIIERFRARRAPWPDAVVRGLDGPQFGLWGSPPRPLGASDRPEPGDETLDLPGARPEPRPPAREQVARSDTPRPPVFLGAGDTGANSPNLIKEPKPKRPEAKRKTATPSPVVATTPSTSVVATTPSATPPSAAPIAAAPPPPANPPPPLTAKNDATPSVVASKAPPPVPAPDAPAPKSKAVNDLPVTPLD